MIFSSIIFLFAFFPAFFIVLYCLPKNIRVRNLWIVIGSLFFYAYGSGTFFFVVLGTLLVDYILGGLIDKYRKYAKLFAGLDTVMNLGILLYCKYFNFFLDNVNAIFLQLDWNPVVFTRVVLPLGVSFIVLQKMTYCLDIAKGTTQPAEKFLDLVEYLFLFPQIIAGPIVKYNEVSEQIRHREITRAMFLYGFQRLTVGLFKKVWIADILAKTVDVVFNAQALGPVPLDYAWLGMFAYSFQIVFDFSAYSDMAIGMLAMMGFHIQENFNKPYISLSVTEYWQRNHISMTSWFREYLYYPLGGNRKGTARTYFNQWIIFLVSGFWHGADWSFVFWGGYNGTILCLERAFLLKKTMRLPVFIRWAATYLILAFGLIFFRADTIGQGFSYVANLFDLSSYYTHLNPAFILTLDHRDWFVLALAAVMSFFPRLTRAYGWLQEKMAGHSGWRSAGVMCLFVLSTMKVATGAISPFIYFKF